MTLHRYLDLVYFLLVEEFRTAGHTLERAIGEVDTLMLPAEEQDAVREAASMEQIDQMLGGL